MEASEHQPATDTWSKPECRQTSGGRNLKNHSVGVKHGDNRKLAAAHECISGDECADRDPVQSSCKRSTKPRPSLQYGIRDLVQELSAEEEEIKRLQASVSAKGAFLMTRGVDPSTSTPKQNLSGQQQSFQPVCAVLCSNLGLHHVSTLVNVGVYGTASSAVVRNPIWTDDGSHGSNKLDGADLISTATRRQLTWF